MEISKWTLAGDHSTVSSLISINQLFCCHRRLTWMSFSAATIALYVRCWCWIACTHRCTWLVRARIDKAVRWFDECRAAKKKTRQLEREYHRCPSPSLASPGRHNEETVSAEGSTVLVISGVLVSWWFEGNLVESQRSRVTVGGCIKLRKPVSGSKKPVTGLRNSSISSLVSSHPFVMHQIPGSTCFLLASPHTGNTTQRKQQLSSAQPSTA